MLELLLLKVKSDPHKVFYFQMHLYCILLGVGLFFQIYLDDFFMDLGSGRRTLAAFTLLRIHMETEHIYRYLLSVV